MRRPGAALAAAYLAVSVATAVLAPRPTRPLFDGFAPPVPYNWVKPPPEFAAGNIRPQPGQQTVPFTDAGSRAANASTPDAQAILSLPAGAVPAHPPDTAVVVTLTPLDASTLGRVPPSLRVVSNAYRVDVVYQPSQAPLTEPAASATIALTAATDGDTLLYSKTGQDWQEVPSRRFGETHGLTGAFAGPGFYLVTASPRVPTSPVTIAPGRPATGGGSGWAAVSIGVVGLAAVVTVVLVQRRGRRRQSRPRGRSRTTRRRP